MKGSPKFPVSILEVSVTLLFSIGLFFLVFSFPVFQALIYGLMATVTAAVLKTIHELLKIKLGFKPSASKGFVRHIIFLFKFFSICFLIIIPLKIFWIYYFYPDVDFGSENLKMDLLERRSFLIDRVSAPDFSESLMPSFLPVAFRKEWAIGTLSMTAAALTNLAFEFPETRKESIEVIAGLIKRMLKKDLRDFEQHYWGIDALEALDTDNGQIGYLGHLNFMLGAYKLLGGGSEYDDLAKKITRALVRRMKKTRGHYLETFPGQIFVPDNMVVVASIASAQKAFDIDSQDILSSWLSHTKTYLLEPETGLITNWVDDQGRGFGGARGSYSCWNSFYLPFVDAEFSRQQFSLIQKHFVTWLPAGLAGVREYPHGKRGSGDIDSGPVIFGLSTSGTGFGLSGASRFGSNKLQRGLLLTAEAVGSTVKLNDKRYYLVAPLIGEAIVLAMRTARDWDTRYLESAGQLE